MHKHDSVSVMYCYQLKETMKGVFLVSCKTGVSGTDGAMLSAHVMGGTKEGV